MSQFKETKLACPECGSSDARAVYHSGVSICFSCGETKAPDGGSTSVELSDDALPFVHGETQEIRSRKLHLDTVRRYRYSVGTTDRGKTVQIAPYYNSKGLLVAQKLRTQNKDFIITGNAKGMGLFGLQLARENGKMIVITEGEIDAMSVSQAMGNTWPVVSLPSGAQSLGAIQDNLEFLEGYDKVVLCFDNDKAGKEGTEAAIELFSPGKAYIATLGDYKDPNDMLKAGKSKELRTAIWEAKAYRPDGIVCLADMRERIEAPLSMGHMYPWPGLNDMLFGYRPKELITWTAGTGVGKTALVSELAHHMITKDGLKVGLIYLEEGVDRAARRLIGIDMNKPIHLPGNDYTKEEFDAAWDNTIGTGRAFAYDHYGSLDSDLLVNRCRHLVRGNGCDVVILDHVSMVVSGNALDTDERRALDRTMTNLRSLTQETGASFHVVSHLRRPTGSGSHEEGLHVSLSHLRGTQAIAQLSDAVIAAERNQQDEDVEKRNTTILRVLKNRYSGLTGAADSLTFDHTTGRLVHAEKLYGMETSIDMGTGDY